MRPRVTVYVLIWPSELFEFEAPALLPGYCISLYKEYDAL